MRIGQRQIGLGHGVYIIAELGVNHDGSVSRAMELVDAAHGAGADAVKLQYFETDRLMSKSAKLAAYQKTAGETDPIAMLRRLELPLSEMKQIVDRAHALGMHAIVTVFSTALVAPAERLAWDAYKTASPDLVHKPLLAALAATGKPLIVSTGAATLEEVNRTAGWMAEWEASARTALLQCVSCYPTPGDRAELGGIGALTDAFDGPVGYSDHTAGTNAAKAATAWGATLLEKHLTYSRGAQGPDHAASLEPGDLAAYCALARAAAKARDEGLDDVVLAPGTHPRLKRVLEIEEDVRRVSRQSVVATRSLQPGEVLGPKDVTIKRPGTGIPAAELDRVTGSRVMRPVEADTVITWEDVQ